MTSLTPHRNRQFRPRSQEEDPTVYPREFNKRKVKVLRSQLGTPIFAFLNFALYSRSFAFIRVHAR